MSTRRAPRARILALLVVAYMDLVVVVGVGVLLLRSGVIGPALWGGALAVLGALFLTVVVVRSAPRDLTRQGIAVDTSGVTLVQDPKLWFAGRTAHIAWSDIVGVNDDAVATGGSGGTRSVVVLLLHDEERVSGPLPTWASVVPTGERQPAGPARVTVEPGDRQPEVIAALRAVRPDLFWGA